jgi:hypothetical protein
MGLIQKAHAVRHRKETVLTEDLPSGERMVPKTFNRFRGWFQELV